MRKLRPLVQASLKATPKAETSTLLSMADNIFEICQTSSSSSSTVFSVSKSKDDQIQELTEQNKHLQSEISEIKQMLANLNARSSRPNFRSRSKSCTRSHSRGNKEFFFYHSRFGTKANKCVKPCSFVNKTKN